MTNDDRPNLQNIPIRTPAGQAIRAAFKPLETPLLIEADYSSLELELSHNHVRIRKPDRPEGRAD